MAADLALDPAGAEQIFSQAHVSSLVNGYRGDRADRGLPVGLYLAAVIAARNDGEPVTVSGETGGWRTVCAASRWSGCPRVFSGSCGARRCLISCPPRSARPY